MRKKLVFFELPKPNYIADYYFEIPEKIGARVTDIALCKSELKPFIEQFIRKDGSKPLLKLIVSVTKQPGSFAVKESDDTNHINVKQNNKFVCTRIEGRVTMVLEHLMNEWDVEVVYVKFAKAR